MERREFILASGGAEQRPWFEALIRSLELVLDPVTGGERLHRHGYSYSIDLSGGIVADYEPEELEQVTSLIGEQRLLVRLHGNGPPSACSSRRHHVPSAAAPAATDSLWAAVRSASRRAARMPDAGCPRKRPETRLPGITRQGDRRNEP
ncbi:hypothetical protein [Streptomyces sp. NPDC004266]|uniref:hypothetical protein n=1 Tax=Streptomyces sp. NPDC004266 TaxID=3364693 RepID=UPI0036960704